MFEKIAELLKEKKDSDLHISIKMKGDEMTVATFMKIEGKDVDTPLILTGTPTEMDIEYIDQLKKPMSVGPTKFTSNADEVAGEIAEEAEETTKKNEKKATTKAAPSAKVKEKSAADIKKEKKEQLKVFLEDAAILFKEQKYAEALLKYNEALELDPENKGIIANIAKCEQLITAEKNLFSDNKEKVVVPEVIMAEEKTEELILDTVEEVQEEDDDNELLLIAE